MISFNRVSFLIISLLFITACNKNLGPKETAQKFWEAAKTGQAEKVKPYVTEASYAALDANNNKTMKGEVVLGELAVNGENASVQTVLTDQGFEIKLKTILIKEAGKWKVDAQATMASMMENMGEIMKGLGEAMGKALGEGMKGLSKGMKGLGEGLKEGMQGMEEAAKDLEKTLNKDEEQKEGETKTEEKPSTE